MVSLLLQSDCERLIRTPTASDRRLRIEKTQHLRAVASSARYGVRRGVGGCWSGSLDDRDAGVSRVERSSSEKVRKAGQGRKGASAGRSTTSKYVLRGSTTALSDDVRAGPAVQGSESGCVQGFFASLYSTHVMSEARQ